MLSAINLLMWLGLYTFRNASTLFSSFGAISRECGWRNSDSLSTCQDPCVVCLEQQCTVAAEGKFLLRVHIITILYLW